MLPALNLRGPHDDQSRERRGFRRPRGQGIVMLTTTLITVWGLGSFTLVMAALYTLTADC